MIRDEPPSGEAPRPSALDRPLAVPGGLQDALAAGWWERSSRSDDALHGVSLKRLGGRVWRSSRLLRGCSP